MAFNRTGSNPMSPESFNASIDALLERRPFIVFTVELKTGKRFEIDHPRAVTTRGGVAVFLSPGGIPIFFDHDSVSEIITAPSSTDVNQPPVA
jgi:hypothetical protein